MRKYIANGAKTLLNLKTYSKIKFSTQQLHEITPTPEKQLCPEKIDKSAIVASVVNQFGDGYEGKWHLTRDDFLEDENLHGLEPVIPGALDECNEDLSHIGPYAQRFFNFAAYVDKHKTLQKLVDLGVSLYLIERNDPDPSFLLRMDFEKDMKPYIMFLSDCGVKSEDLARFITKNPRIFLENLDDLATRVRYFRAHSFSREMVARLVNTTPRLLNRSTKEIDAHLGHIQSQFKLKKWQVRGVVVKCPPLITINPMIIKENYFAVKEEMGFEVEETSALLLARPSIFTESNLPRFTYIHINIIYLHNITEITTMFLSLLAFLSRARKHGQDL